MNSLPASKSIFAGSTAGIIRSLTPGNRIKPTDNADNTPSKSYRKEIHL
jgi:hypothetical protein